MVGTSTSVSQCSLLLLMSEAGPASDDIVSKHLSNQERVSSSVEVFEIWRRARN